MATGDSVDIGFGFRAGTLLLGSAITVIARYIPSSPGTAVAIRTIDLFGVQTALAKISQLSATVIVVRGSSQLGIGAKGTLEPPLRPTSSGLSASQNDVQNVVPLAQFKVNLAAPVPRNYGPDDLVAMNGDKLCVIVSPGMSEDAAPPTTNDITFLSLTVLGDPEHPISSRGGPLGDIRSLPRY